MFYVCVSQVNFDRMCSRAIRNTVESLAVSNRETAIHQECYNITNLLLKIGNPRVALATGGWATNQLETGTVRTVLHIQNCKTGSVEYW